MKSWFLEEINKIDMAFSQIKQKKKRDKRPILIKYKWKEKHYNRHWGNSKNHKDNSLKIYIPLNRKKNLKKISEYI